MFNDHIAAEALTKFTEMKSLIDKNTKMILLCNYNPRNVSHAGLKLVLLDENCLLI
jgi:hypothetical protein